MRANEHCFLVLTKYFSDILIAISNELTILNYIEKV